MTSKTLFSKPVKKTTLAEKLAEETTALILSGDLQSGSALPTEVELADQYGVSRAVVRDATRMLMARGLVEVQHGKGVFVTSTQNSAFGEALLLALKRAHATAWDVEQFEMLLIPEVVALATEMATPEELSAIRSAVEDYLETYKTLITLSDEQIDLVDVDQAQLNQRFLQKYRVMVEKIYQATHNKVLQQLARPLLNLRNFRNWQLDEQVSSTEMESTYFTTLLEVIETGDPDAARSRVRSLMHLPPEAKSAMQKTPIGEVPFIPTPPSAPHPKDDAVA